MELLFLFAGLLLGAAVVWLLLKGRIGLLHERISLHEEQNKGLLQEQRQSRDRENGLRRELQEAAAKRSAAEEKNSRIPGLEESLRQKALKSENLQQEISGLKSRLSEVETRLEGERKNSEEKLDILNRSRQQLKEEFQNLANKIFEDKSRKFTDQNKENLSMVLNPVREQLKEFKQKIDDVYDKESKDRVSLFHQINQLKKINLSIGEEAVNLTRALKGQTRTQGVWGEMILERILEESGLHKGREYEAQGSYLNEAGKHLRPDVVVHLPDGKDVVIDSKVSLTAYERYCSATTGEEKEKQLQHHILSVRSHFKLLSEKRYEELAGIRSLDFVLMFLPIEGSFMAALDGDPQLFSDAFARNIMLVSPTTLLATLRTIQNIWRYEYQSRNAQEIAKKAGDLHDKFVGFVATLDDVGNKIGKARDAYDKARKQLTSGRGDLVSRTNALIALGVKAKKALPGALVEEAEEAE